MSSHAATVSPAMPAESPSTASTAGKALTVGLAGIALTALGLVVPGAGARVVALSWLVGVTYWTAIAIGMLMAVL
ncbi:MAG: hypothetical protein NT049_14425, partial [Planctomycetota bacterium]|nr:hypothetical protein [Planctomycetota bacterium]